MLTQSEINVLRALAQTYADIAASSRNDEARKLWTLHNDLETCRPMVLIDQVCWSEMDVDGALNCVVSNPYWAKVELWLRQAIYQNAHMRVDRVFTPYILLPRRINSTGWGINVVEEQLRIDPSSEVRAHKYINQITDFDSLERIHFPTLTLDEMFMERATALAEHIFDGIIPFRLTGSCPHLGLWDTISAWMGVENCYIEIMDRPELIHALMEKLTQGTLHMLDQMDEMGLYDVTSTLCHCSHTHSSRPPYTNLYMEHPTAADSWAFGLAQLFSSVSPRITEEFEVAYMRRIFPRFGAIYYGCCDRLDDRLDIICKLPNVRKISCSPWSDRLRFAERLPDGFIMSNKPTPALLAFDAFDEDAVRRDIRETISVARAFKRPLELILKDISTVRRDPERLWRWARIAMEEVNR